MEECQGVNLVYSEGHLSGGHFSEGHLSEGDIWKDANLLTKDIKAESPCFID